MSPSPPGDPATLLGARLAAHDRRLRLLITHLAGHAVRARVEVEDLVQEVYLRALAASSRPRPQEGADALWRFLAHLARHAVVDCARALRAARRDGGERVLSRSDWSRVAAGAAPGPATVAGLAEVGRELARRFLALTPEHRRVIGLRQFEGLPARECARRMGRTETAIHSLYRRALAAWEVEDLDRNEP
jgi:RNA polymerase sigma factor (sigma-70 family)